MPSQKLPRFFITHSWGDADFARRLADDLRAQGLEGFFDMYSVQPGDDIVARINTGLEECDVYVPLLSVAALKSPWCDEEINAAIMLSKQRGRGGKPRIIPLLIEDCATALPPLLQHRLYINVAQVGYRAAVNELIEKGFGVTRRVPPDAQPTPALPTLPPRTWIAVGGGVIGVFVLLALIGAWIAGQSTTTLSPTRIAPVTATLALTAGATTPVAPPTNAPMSAAQRRGNDNAEMVAVPAGEFVMGNDGRYGESPQHTVFLDAFWIDKYEVTNALYKKCVDAGKCSSPSTQYFGNPRYDNHPVVYVTWNDAAGYCAWAGKRLPTEAEWEKAARGTDGRIFPWGNTFNKNYLNSAENGRGEVLAVGSFPDGASPYGAMDMAGNVWEWVADWHDAEYYSTSPARNPKGPPVGTTKVIRGGAKDVDQNSARVTLRVDPAPDTQSGTIGFRCAQ